MKTNARWMVALAACSVALAMILAGCSNVVGDTEAATTKEGAEAVAMMNNLDAQQRAAATARAKDPSWKPATTEVGLIQVGDSKRPGVLKNFCLNAEGNILACLGASIRVHSPKGELLKTLPLEIKAGAISVAKDGSIFVAGDGQLLKLDASGKVLAKTVSPVAKEPVVITKEIEEMLKQSGRGGKAECDKMKTSLEARRSEVNGMAVTDQDVFMTVPSPSDFTYRVYRFDHALQNPKLVVEKLRGCCGQMDLQAHEGKLWIPHNGRHVIESRDRDGKELAKFGKAGKVKADDFGGCCEPKSLRVLPNGDLLAAESGPPTCIKRFSADGKFLGVIAVIDDSKGDCVRVTVEVSPDGSRYYLMDTKRDAIHVFGTKG